MDYAKFTEKTFGDKLKESLMSEKTLSYVEFEEIFLSVLNKHVHVKKKVVRANQINTKIHRKAIMKRSALSYKKQREKGIILISKV